MANFPQYWSHRNELYCLYYVCGEEVCLRERVITTIKQTAKPNPLDYYSLDGATDKIADIMSTLTQEPATNRKLVLIRNGQRIKQFDRIVDWAKQIANFTDTCLVVQTDEINPPTSEPKFRPFVELGSFVECKPLTESRLLEWLRTFIEITDDTFKLLLDICGWELPRVINEASKLRFLGRVITNEDVESNCRRTYDERFVDLLLAGNKIGAVNALSMLRFSDGAKVIGLLDYKLNLLLQLALLRRQGVSLKDAVQRLNISFFVAKLHWDLCQAMTIQMIRKRLSLLVSTDTAFKAGNIGALEIMLIQW